VHILAHLNKRTFSNRKVTCIYIYSSCKDITCEIHSTSLKKMHNLRCLLAAHICICDIQMSAFYVFFLNELRVKLPQCLLSLMILAICFSTSRSYILRQTNNNKLSVRRRHWGTDALSHPNNLLMRSFLNANCRQQIFLHNTAWCIWYSKLIWNWF